MFYQLTENKSGHTVLTVFYDSELKNWNQGIEQAIEDAGLNNEPVTVIAKPWPEKRPDRNLSTYVKQGVNNAQANH